MPELLGALRLAGINAGERDTTNPFMASRSMMGIHSAVSRIQPILRQHGLLLRDPLDVSRPDPRQVVAKFPLYHIVDESRRVGMLIVTGEINPVDKGTMSFRANFDVPSYPNDNSAPKHLF